MRRVLIALLLLFTAVPALAQFAKFREITVLRGGQLRFSVGKDFRTIYLVADDLLVCLGPDDMPTDIETCFTVRDLKRRLGR